MALLQDGRQAATLAAIESKTKALRVTQAPRGLGYTLSGTSGVIAAGAAAGSTFFAMRVSPTSGNYFAFIEKLRVQFTTLTAFSTSVSPGRRLSIYRGSGAALSGGTALAPAQKDVSASLSNVASGQGGDARISTTSGLGATGLTWEGTPFREMALTHCGPSGSNEENVYEFLFGSSPIVLQPGQVFAIRTPAAMDAGGTFQVSVDCDYSESVSFGSVIVD